MLFRSNDDYVSSVMGVDTVDAYLTQVKSNLDSSNESQKESATQQAILDKLVEICEVSDYPEGLIEKRIEQRKEYYQSYATSYGTDLATFLSTYVGMTEEQFDAELQESIPSIVSQEMILLAIADKEGITDDEDAYDAYVEDIISTNGFGDKDTLLSAYAESYVKRMYCQDKALEFVSGKADVTYTGAAAEETVEEATEDAIEK